MLVQAVISISVWLWHGCCYYFIKFLPSLVTGGSYAVGILTEAFKTILVHSIKIHFARHWFDQNVGMV